MAISREWQKSARRIFWIATLICLGLPILGIVAVTRPGFHYKSEQTMVLGMASFLIPAWIFLGGLSALVGFGLRVYAEPVIAALAARQPTASRGERESDGMEAPPRTAIPTSP